MKISFRILIKCFCITSKFRTSTVSFVFSPFFPDFFWMLSSGLMVTTMIPFIQFYKNPLCSFKKRSVLISPGYILHATGYLSFTVIFNILGVHVVHELLSKNWNE
jgi:hypothetical protein